MKVFPSHSPIKPPLSKKIITNFIVIKEIILNKSIKSINKKIHL